MTSPVIRPADGQLNQRIANAVVRAQKDVFGRGPTKAQAFFRHNFVVVVMEDALTAAERRLADGGEHDAVIRMRQRYQQLMREELVGPIERLTATKVEAFVSGNHIDPDVVFELFVLDRAVPGERLDPGA
jgi:uncharacterized protein YbcI